MEILVAWIGFGRLARALVAHAVAVDSVAPACMIGTHYAEETAHRLRHEYGIDVGTSNAAAATTAACTALCVRPNQCLSVANEIASSMTREKIVISFAPRVSLRELRELLPECGAIFRASPMHKALGASSSRFFISEEQDTGTEAHRRLYKLFGRFGELVVVPEQSQDIYGVFASCGPAFFARIRRMWAESAVAYGIERRNAELIATALAPAASGRLGEGHDQQIEQNIATAGGVTEAALSALEQSDMIETLRGAVQAALARMDELDRAYRERPDLTRDC